MKLILVIGLLVMTPRLIAVGQVVNKSAAINDKVEQEIRLVEEKRRESLLKSDITALDLILANEYIVTNQFGEIRTKAQLLSDLKSGTLIFESIEEDELIFRVYENTVVVTGRATSKHADRETMQTRFTRVYVKRDGRWQTVVYQVTRFTQR